MIGNSFCLLSAILRSSKPGVHNSSESVEEARYPYSSQVIGRISEDALLKLDAKPPSYAYLEGSADRRCWCWCIPSSYLAASSIYKSWSLRWKVYQIRVEKLDKLFILYSDLRATNAGERENLVPAIEKSHTCFRPS